MIMSDDEFNPLYVQRELVEPIKQAIKNKSAKEIKTKHNLPYKIGVVAINSFESIYVLEQDSKVVAATKLAAVKGILQIQLTNKFFDEYKDVLRILYKHISKSRKAYIFTNNKQTKVSAYIWKKMIKQDNCSVKVLYRSKEIPFKEEDIELYWSSEDYLIGVKY
jgi:hypothetical protein